ncbi:MAG: hypothetical protein K2F95_06630 [Alistipes sp.]|nr:hypothetical protein [Alistipes sp.]MDE7129229.1 hypothetical protein [Alistipes sp.]
MVNQVNNIIFNLIVSGRGVWLPDIAALRVVRRAAEHGSSSRTILPPRLAVEFTSHREGVSLVDEIARVAAIDESAARDIYDRWIDKTLSDGVLTIDGIGVLRGKSFVADAALTSLLNADTGGAVKIVVRRRSHRMLALSALLAVVAVAAGALYWFMYRDMQASLPDAEPSAAVVQLADFTEESHNIVRAEPMPESGDDVGTDAVASSSDVAAEDEAAAIVEAEAVVPAPVRESDIRYRVIIGSYSTRENAVRAIAEAEKRVSGLHFEIRPLGRLFAVAAFGSSTREDCEAFVREHRKEFPQAWVNPAKR